MRYRYLTVVNPIFSTIIKYQVLLKMSEFQQFMHIVLELLESSSDSEEEDDLLQELINIPQSIPKTENYINIVEQFNNDQFRSHFRINWMTFEELENKFLQSEFSRKHWTGGSANTPPRKQLLAFLWFIANKCVIRDVSDRFHISLSTVHKCITNVTDFILEIAPTEIKFPNSLDGKIHLAEEFREISQFPQVIGCIDGTYINIRTPAHKVKSTYVNRHDATALTLQGICDPQKRFLDVFTGVSGKMHDARVFSLSFISNDLTNICNGDSFHLLVDSAYPLRTYLLTPYKDYGNLTDMQRNYNKRLSQTRVKIENAFGLLKQRFRQLMRLESKTVDNASKIITACCVIHNICINLNDIWEDEENEGNEEVEEYPEDNRQTREAGSRKRDHICNLLGNVI